MLLEKVLSNFMFLLFVNTLVKANTGPIISTAVGLIKGLNAADGDYSMFLGIPFGQVDVDNPFGVATPYKPFDNVFEAYDDSVVCPQQEEFNNTVVGSLNCLNLNVFLPHKASSNNQLPILVWIYGGGFIIGFGNRYLYGPSFLVRHDIILVTINYRIGPYGFMCLNTPEIPGNQGLKDQLLALRWIYRNIEAFGGDTNKITIFGESAGAMSVDMHLQSNNEKLYSKAILHSGTMLSPIFFEPMRNAPIVLAENLGFKTESINEALNFLTKTDTHLVVSAVENLKLRGNFRPCIEEVFDGVENIVTKNWITAKYPKVKDMPILIGFNNNEMFRFHTPEGNENYPDPNIIQNILSVGFDIADNEFLGMEDIVRHFYFGNKPINDAVNETATDFESDFMFIHPTYRSISKYLDNDAGNVFLYVFSYVGERNFKRILYNISGGSGAVHGDELGYLFDMTYLKNRAITPKDQNLIDKMTTMWTNFVKTGNPTPRTTSLLPVQWPPVANKSELNYLNITSQLTVDSRPFNQRATFWDLFYKTNERLQMAYPSAKINF